MNPDEKTTKFEIKEMSPVASWSWKAVMFIAQLIAAAAKEDITNEQKKELVSQEVMNFLQNFDIPLPFFVINELVGLAIDLIYGVMKDQLNLFGGDKD